MLGLLAALFRCRHRTISRVFKMADGAHYVLCLDCGKRFEYDWGSMEIGAEVKQ